MKLSIMLLIKRVFCSVQRDVPYWLTVFLIFINTGFYLAFLIVLTALCSPRSKIWMPEVPGKCVDVLQLVSSDVVCTQNFRGRKCPRIHASTIHEEIFVVQINDHRFTALVLRLRSFQPSFRYFDVEYTDLFSVATSNVDSPQDWYFCYLFCRWTVSLIYVPFYRTSS